MSEKTTKETNQKVVQELETAAAAMGRMSRDWVVITRSLSEVEKRTQAHRSMTDAVANAAFRFLEAHDVLTATLRAEQDGGKR